MDECLSVELVTVAAQPGYEAHHVAHVGKAGWKDWNVLRHACENDFVLVTNNAADFRKLYAERRIACKRSIVHVLQLAVASVPNVAIGGKVRNPCTSYNNVIVLRRRHRPEREHTDELNRAARGDF